ncbi:MAG: cupin domain-containing protein [Simkania sp.]|nr:cupin domain-containing protein [Simkania sp.]
MISLLAMLVPAVVINENLTIYPLVPPEADQSWKLELFELAEPIPAHYHKLQRQYILVTEGKLEACYGGHDPIILRSGELVHTDPGMIHALTPKGRARFLAIDLPGFNFPEDVFYDQPMAVTPWTPMHRDPLPPLDERYFASKVEKGDYTAYELVKGEMTGDKWSAALLDIQDSPKHFHRVESEHFIVAHGTLDVEIDGLHHIVNAGESILITPGKIHKLTSANKTPVQVLCFSFPAFDLADMYCVE